MNKSLLLVLIGLMTLLTSGILFSATTPEFGLLPDVSPQDFITRVTTQNNQVQATLDNKLNQLLQSRSTPPESTNTPPPAPIETPVAAPVSTPSPAATPSDNSGFNMYSPS